MAEPNGTGPETESHSQKPDDTQNQAVGDSTTDNGLSRRPRDARVIHLMLSSMGVNAYQERVPLQIMDFAYREY